MDKRTNSEGNRDVGPRVDRTAPSKPGDHILVLPRGITGFWRAKDESLPGSTIPRSDTRVFREHCFLAARDLGGRIIQKAPEDSLSVCNFTCCVLEVRDGFIEVLLNRIHPFVAFAEPTDTQDSILHSFVDCPELEKIFRGFGLYTVLDASQLNQAVVPEMFENLLFAELEQIKYWNPSRIGNVIFNYWD